MPDEPSADILARFVHGDRDAFEALFRAFHVEVHRWGLRIVRDSSGADDVVVETFWRAYRGRARFDPSRSFGAWMRRIATNTAIDQLNAGRRRNWIPLDAVTAGRVPRRTGAMRDGPDDFELRDAIRRAFVALPPTLRIVATLALIEGVPHAEIADAIGVSIGTVKSRLFRATRKLRKELEPHER